MLRFSLFGRVCQVQRETGAVRSVWPAERRSDMAAMKLWLHGAAAGAHERAAEIQLATLIFCMCVSAL